MGGVTERHNAAAEAIVKHPEDDSRGRGFWFRGLWREHRNEIDMLRQAEVARVAAIIADNNPDPTGLVEAAKRKGAGE